MPRDMAAEASLRALGRAFLVLTAVTYALLVFGASVRVHGAGLACPDWPLCFGELVPQLDFHIFLEWGHRVFASLVSFGFLALAVLTWRLPEARRRLMPVLGIAAVVLAAQIVLGGLTVLHLLAFWSVTLHLLFGNLFCALMLVCGLRLLDVSPAAEPVSPAARGLAVGLVAMVFVQMGLGGLVSSSYAGLACTEWPTCNGGVWFPVWDGIIGLQLFHRLGAYVLTAVAAALAFATRGDRRVGAPARLVIVLVFSQVCIGIVNVLLAMPVEVAILHSAVADLIVLASAWTLSRALAAPVRGRAPAIAFGGEPGRA